MDELAGLCWGPSLIPGGDGLVLVDSLGYPEIVHVGSARDYRVRRLWSAERPRPPSPPSNPPHHPQPPIACGVSPDGRFLAVAVPIAGGPAADRSHLEHVDSPWLRRAPNSELHVGRGPAGLAIWFRPGSASERLIRATLVGPAAPASLGVITSLQWRAHSDRASTLLGNGPVNGEARDTDTDEPRRRPLEERVEADERAKLSGLSHEPAVLLAVHEGSGRATLWRESDPWDGVYFQCVASFGPVGALARWVHIPRVEADGLLSVAPGDWRSSARAVEDPSRPRPSPDLCTAGWPWHGHFDTAVAAVAEATGQRPAPGHSRDFLISGSDDHAHVWMVEDVSMVPARSVRVVQWAKVGKGGSESGPSSAVMPVVLAAATWVTPEDPLPDTRSLLPYLSSSALLSVRLAPATKGSGVRVGPAPAWTAVQALRILAGDGPAVVAEARKWASEGGRSRVLRVLGEEEGGQTEGSSRTSGGRGVRREGAPNSLRVDLLERDLAVRESGSMRVDSPVAGVDPLRSGEQLLSIAMDNDEGLNARRHVLDSLVRCARQKRMARRSLPWWRGGAEWVEPGGSAEMSAASPPHVDAVTPWGEGVDEEDEGDSAGWHRPPDLLAPAQVSTVAAATWHMRAPAPRGHADLYGVLRKVRAAPEPRVLSLIGGAPGDWHCRLGVIGSNPVGTAAGAGPARRHETPSKQGSWRGSWSLDDPRAALRLTLAQGGEGAGDWTEWWPARGMCLADGVAGRGRLLAVRTDGRRIQICYLRHSESWDVEGPVTEGFITGVRGAWWDASTDNGARLLVVCATVHGDVWVRLLSIPAVCSSHAPPEGRWERVLTTRSPVGAGLRLARHGDALRVHRLALGATNRKPRWFIGVVWEGGSASQTVCGAVWLESQLSVEGKLRVAASCSPASPTDNTLDEVPQWRPSGPIAWSVMSEDGKAWCAIAGGGSSETCDGCAIVLLDPAVRCGARWAGMIGVEEQEHIVSLSIDPAGWIATLLQRRAENDGGRGFVLRICSPTQPTLSKQLQLLGIDNDEIRGWQWGRWLTVAESEVLVSTTAHAEVQWSQDMHCDGQMPCARHLWVGTPGRLLELAVGRSPSPERAGDFAGVSPSPRYRTRGRGMSEEEPVRESVGLRRGMPAQGPGGAWFRGDRKENADETRMAPTSSLARVGAGRSGEDRTVEEVGRRRVWADDELELVSDEQWDWTVCRSFVWGRETARPARWGFFLEDFVSAADAGVLGRGGLLWDSRPLSPHPGSTDAVWLWWEERDPSASLHRMVAAPVYASQDRAASSATAASPVDPEQLVALIRLGAVDMVQRLLAHFARWLARAAAVGDSELLEGRRRAERRESRRIALLRRQNVDGAASETSDSDSPEELTDDEDFASPASSSPQHGRGQRRRQPKPAPPPDGGGLLLFGMSDEESEETEEEADEKEGRERGAGAASEADWWGGADESKDAGDRRPPRVVGRQRSATLPNEPAPNSLDALPDPWQLDSWYQGSEVPPLSPWIPGLPTCKLPQDSDSGTSTTLPLLVVPPMPAAFLLRAQSPRAGNHGRIIGGNPPPPEPREADRASSPDDELLVFGLSDEDESEAEGEESRRKDESPATTQTSVRSARGDDDSRTGSVREDVAEESTRAAHASTPIWRSIADRAVFSAHPWSGCERDDRREGTGTYETLSRSLSKVRLQDLSPGESTMLSAIATAVHQVWGLPDLASCDSLTATEPSGGWDAAAGVVALKPVAGAADGNGGAAAALDPAGARALLGGKLIQLARRLLPPRKRPSAFPLRDVVWALLSDSQDALLPWLVPPRASWHDLRVFRVPLWLRSTEALRQVVERAAQNQFRRGTGGDKGGVPGRGDPYACFLFYVCLGPAKLSVLARLLELGGAPRIAQFLKRDFAHDVSARRAAARNAFGLLSRHKVEQAVGLFILAGRWRLAVRTCLDRLRDPMLALLVARLVPAVYPPSMGAEESDVEEEIGDESEPPRPVAGWAFAGSGMGAGSRPYGGVDVVRLLSDVEQEENANEDPAEAGEHGSATAPPPPHSASVLTGASTSSRRTDVGETQDEAARTAATAAVSARVLSPMEELVQTVLTHERMRISAGPGGAPWLGFLLSWLQHDPLDAWTWLVRPTRAASRAMRTDEPGLAGRDGNTSESDEQPAEGMDNQEESGGTLRSAGSSADRAEVADWVLRRPQFRRDDVARALVHRATGLWIDRHNALAAAALLSHHLRGAAVAQEVDQGQWMLASALWRRMGRSGSSAWHAAVDARLWDADRAIERQVASAQQRSVAQAAVLVPALRVPRLSAPGPRLSFEWNARIRSIAACLMQPISSGGSRSSRLLRELADVAGSVQSEAAQGHLPSTDATVEMVGCFAVGALVCVAAAESVDFIAVQSLLLRQSRLAQWNDGDEDLPKLSAIRRALAQVLPGFFPSLRGEKGEAGRCESAGNSERVVDWTNCFTPTEGVGRLVARYVRRRLRDEPVGATERSPTATAKPVSSWEDWLDRTLAAGISLLTHCHLLGGAQLLLGFLARLQDPTEGAEGLLHAMVGALRRRTRQTLARWHTTLRNTPSSDEVVNDGPRRSLIHALTGVRDKEPSPVAPGAPRQWRMRRMEAAARTGSRMAAGMGNTHWDTHQRRRRRRLESEALDEDPLTEEMVSAERQDLVISTSERTAPMAWWLDLWPLFAFFDWSGVTGDREDIQSSWTAEAREAGPRPRPHAPDSQLRRKVDAGCVVWWSLGGPALLWGVAGARHGNRCARLRGRGGYVPEFRRQEARVIVHEDEELIAAMTARESQPDTFVVATSAGVSEIKPAKQFPALPSSPWREELSLMESMTRVLAPTGLSTPHSGRLWVRWPRQRLERYTDGVEDGGWEWDRADFAASLVGATGWPVLSWNLTRETERLSLDDLEVQQQMFGLGQDHDITRQAAVTRLEHHPFLPLYASGGVSGQVLLWKVGQNSGVCRYVQWEPQPASAESRGVGPGALGPPARAGERITCLQWSPNGLQLFAGDTKGGAWLWNATEPARASLSFAAHGTRASAAVFLHSDTLVAVAGGSPAAMDDSLAAPPRRRRELPSRPAWSPQFARTHDQGHPRSRTPPTRREANADLPSERVATPPPTVDPGHARAPLGSAARRPERGERDAAPRRGVWGTLQRGFGGLVGSIAPSHLASEAHHDRRAPQWGVGEIKKPVVASRGLPAEPAQSASQGSAEGGEGGGGEDDLWEYRFPSASPDSATDATLVDEGGLSPPPRTFSFAPQGFTARWNILQHIRFRPSIVHGVADGGIRAGPTLRVFDARLPLHRCCVVSASLHSTTAQAVAYDDSSRSLISGSQRGDISVLDLRTMVARQVIPDAHSRGVKVARIDPSDRFLATGSTDGSVKIWRLPDLALCATLPDLHPERTYLNHKLADTLVAHYGVTDLRWTEGSLLSAGTDGRVWQIPKSW